MSFTNRGSKEPFSFHCIICYEFLSPHERPPVVLPCGHTYVCEHCAKRLDKCMECREPLKRSFPKPATASQATPVVKEEEIFGWRDIQRQRQQQNLRRRMYSHDAVTPERKQALINQGETSISLPTPKNLVLISLIESVMFGHKDELQNDKEEGYESGDDDEFVRQSMRVVGSSCGTYVVRDFSGISVYDHPRGGVDASADGPKEVKKLEYGQTVQILSLEDGVATVGRGGGYIHVGKSSQLVKVGEPVDKACTLQTAHKVLSQELAALEERLAHVRMVEQRLAGKVLEALADPENSNPFGPEPVPEAPPSPAIAIQTPPPLVVNANQIPTASFSSDHNTPSSSLQPTPQGPDHLAMPNLPESRDRLSPSFLHNPIPIRATKSYDEHRDVIPDDESLQSAQSVGVIETARNSLRYDISNHNDDDIATVFGCGDILTLSFLGDISSCSGQRRIRRRGDAPNIVQHPRRLAEASQDGDATVASSAPAADSNRATSVNWATGLSGHSGLNRAAKPKNQGGTTPQRQVRMMSEHRGASHIGPFAKSFSNTFSATSW